MVLPLNTEVKQNPFLGSGVPIPKSAVKGTSIVCAAFSEERYFFNGIPQNTLVIQAICN